ncbi:MAG: carbon starvation CstA family protein, partial [Pirellulales bacterium]
LFITIACGAVSGFHCLVSSGTSSKQVANEVDAQYVGYGAMLLEGALAVIVILACCAGIGMGQFERKELSASASASRFVRPYTYVEASTAGSQPLRGRAAWESRYDPSKGWRSFKLGQMVGAFVDGGANFVAAIGIPLKLAVGVIAVLVACFAATTLDTATRLQRYVIQELAVSLRIAPLTNKYAATGLAVFLAVSVAMIPGPDGKLGKGGLYLWPLFGAINQLLAGLALMVTLFYLWRRNKRMWFALTPMLIMIVMPAWALTWQMFNDETGWYWTGNRLLFGIGVTVMLLQVWMTIEASIACPRARGVLEEALPPLPGERSDAPPAADTEPVPVISSGRSC